MKMGAPACLQISVCVGLILMAMVCSLASSQEQNVNIMVPAYFYPGTAGSSGAAAWAALNSAATALPNRVVAVANPFNGPGASTDPAYTAAITSLQSASGRVIGYVHTAYTNRSLDSVKADVDQWYAFYPTLDGIFVDEVANIEGMQAYYQTLYIYIKSKSSSSLVVNNPGTSTLPTYLFYNGSRVADIICTFENNGSVALQWTQAAWTFAYPRSNFLTLAYDVPDIDVSSFDYGDIIDRAYQQNAGWVYITDDILDNPWDTVATYFSKEVDYIVEDNYLPS
eukprot:c21777_g2_i1 orf=95-940(+)